jgi:hypothetical protein
MNALALVNTVSYAAATASRPPAPPMDVLMVCGFMTAILTFLLWMYQGRSKAAGMALAICLAAMAVFGFLAGAWPLGFVVIAWSGSVFARWRKQSGAPDEEMERSAVRVLASPGLWHNESRITWIRSELN